MANLKRHRSAIAVLADEVIKASEREKRWSHASSTIFTGAAAAFQSLAPTAEREREHEFDGNMPIRRSSSRLEGRRLATHHDRRPRSEGAFSRSTTPPPSSYSMPHRRGAMPYGGGGRKSYFDDESPRFGERRNAPRGGRAGGGGQPAEWPSDDSLSPSHSANGRASANSSSDRSAPRSPGQQGAANGSGGRSPEKEASESLMMMMRPKPRRHTSAYGTHSPETDRDRGYGLMRPVSTPLPAPGGGRRGVGALDDPVHRRGAFTPSPPPYASLSYARYGHRSGGGSGYGTPPPSGQSHVHAPVQKEIRQELGGPVETPKAKPRAGRIPMSAYKQGMKVKIRGPEFHNKKMQRKLRAYMGGTATIHATPIYPGTWFSLRMDDGVVIKCRSSAFHFADRPDHLKFPPKQRVAKPRNHNAAGTTQTTMASSSSPASPTSAHADGNGVVSPRSDAGSASPSERRRQQLRRDGGGDKDVTGVGIGGGDASDAMEDERDDAIESAVGRRRGLAAASAAVAVAKKNGTGTSYSYDANGMPREEAARDPTPRAQTGYSLRQKPKKREHDPSFAVFRPEPMVSAKRPKLNNSSTNASTSQTSHDLPSGLPSATLPPARAASQAAAYSQPPPPALPGTLHQRGFSGSHTNSFFTPRPPAAGANGDSKKRKNTELTGAHGLPLPLLAGQPKKLKSGAAAGALPPLPMVPPPPPQQQGTAVAAAATPLPLPTPILVRESSGGNGGALPPPAPIGHRRQLPPPPPAVASGGVSPTAIESGALPMSSLPMPTVSSTMPDFSSMAAASVLPFPARATQPLLHKPTPLAFTMPHALSSPAPSSSSSSSGVSGGGPPPPPPPSAAVAAAAIKAEVASPMPDTGLMAQESPASPVICRSAADASKPRSVSPPTTSQLSSHRQQQQEAADEAAAAAASASLPPPHPPASVSPPPQMGFVF